MCLMRIVLTGNEGLPLPRRRLRSTENVGLGAGARDWKSVRPAGGIGTNAVNILLKFAFLKLLWVPPLQVLVPNQAHVLHRRELVFKTPNRIIPTSAINLYFSSRHNF